MNCVTGRLNIRLGFDRQGIQLMTCLFDKTRTLDEHSERTLDDHQLDSTPIL
jgi:hypothetical protein